MKQYYERIDLGATLYSKYDENTHEYKLDEAYAKLNKENELRISDAIDKKESYIKQIIQSNNHQRCNYIYYTNLSEKALKILKSLGTVHSFTDSAPVRLLYATEIIEETFVSSGYTGSIDDNGKVSISRDTGVVKSPALKIDKYDDVDQEYTVYYVFINDPSLSIKQFDDYFTYLITHEAGNEIKDLLNGREEKAIFSVNKYATSLFIAFILQIIAMIALTIVLFNRTPLALLIASIASLVLMGVSLFLEIIFTKGDLLIAGARKKLRDGISDERYKKMVCLTYNGSFFRVVGFIVSFLVLASSILALLGFFIQPLYDYLAEASGFTIPIAIFIAIVFLIWAFKFQSDFTCIAPNYQSMTRDFRGEDADYYQKVVDYLKSVIVS